MTKHLRSWLYNALAPRRDNSRGRFWRYVGRHVPMIWLQPPLLGGKRLLIRPTDWSQTLIFDEIFVRRAYDLRAMPFAPELVVDCGAHIGMFSLLAAATFPNARLVAFEPHPENIAMIKRQIAGNALRLELNEAAVSVRAGSSRFIEWNSHSGHLGAQDSTAPPGFDVDVIDFPAFMAQFKPTSLLLKMDVEGEEAAVLPALVPQLPAKCALFFETHSGDSGWNNARKLLSKHNFQVNMLSSRSPFFDGYAIRA